MKTSSDHIENVIKLQLKKPKRWNWELTASKSAPNISLPAIHLYDSKGKLLVDTNGDEKLLGKNCWKSSDLKKERMIQKSKSDVNFEKKNQNFNKNQRSVSMFTTPYKPLDRYRINLESKINDENKKYYKKSSTENLYDKLKFNNQYLRSSNESVKRAVEDGFDNFLKSKLKPDNNNNNHNNINNNNNMNNNENIKKSILKKQFSNENQQNLLKPEINRVKHNKYITRTCSAGTLVIREESFSNPNMRRRKRFGEKSEYINDSDRKVNKFDLIHAKSDVYPFQQRHKSAERKVSFDQDITRNVLKPLKRRKSGNRIKSSSSSSSDYEKNNNRARVIKEHTRSRSGQGDGDLLRLVQRLSKEANNNAPKMGANVSRHSAKGLSGRRTQSSGSICNGKGSGTRHGDAKICGSLPSYLDDGGINNNQRDCEKLEDERIPPLGDGAPLHWKFSDNQTALCDQGYGSERSPEEEYPPPLPEHDNQCHHHLELHSCYPFITPESTFTVSLSKGSRGLGLSVTGGVDSGGSWPGLIRVKRLFPHQPASSSEMLNVGDLILEVNGITLTGLTNYEALEVLRTAPNQVELKMCRPPPDVLSCVSPISEVPPPPPRREPPTNLSLASCSDDEHCHGEFEITMRKMQGSLGFTLRKEDDSALGHYIRALVREPALTDGRIRAGDKIIAVNEVEISSMTHEEAVQFLRQSGELVKLRLYRDLAQTPVATLSPTETTPRTSFSKKTQLRQEAVDMLNDIAVRKLIPGNNQQEQQQYRRSLSPSTSPRQRLRRREPCPSDASNNSDSSSRHLITDEVFHEGLLKKCSLPLDEDSFNSLFIEDDDSDKLPSRPSSLDLYNPNQTPVASRKPKFNFSLAHNAYELNNLDAEILDAPNLNYNIGEEGTSTEVECGDSFPQEPASMPHIPAADNPGFSYKNPAYQSAHPPCGTENFENNTGVTAGKTISKGSDEGNTNMKKWKGVVFTADEERERQKVLKKEGYRKGENDYEILAIELNRGWNSRLGFSLQGAAGVTYVSAVHADSVAARDGRIKPGDRLIKVNDESVENMTTSEIIDLLRIVRGPVCIIVSRAKNKEDCIISRRTN